MDWATADLHGVSGDVFPVISFVGDLDIESSEVFRGAVLVLLIVVNLDEVPFMDSTGLSVLITCHKAAVAKGVECRFVISVPKVARVVETTRVNTFLSIYPTNESAISVI
jgi:anti-anti-sigma factor